MSKLTKINPEECLPKNLVVKDVDDVLYRIGLSLISVKEHPKRWLIDNPMIVFVINSIFLMEKVVTCCLSEDHEQVFRMLASSGHFLSIRRCFDLHFLLDALLILFSQLIYYYNHKRRVCPTFLRLFSMMSGTIPPEALGLTDPEVVTTLCRRSAKWFKKVPWHNDYFTLLFAPAFLLPFYYYKVMTAVFSHVYARLNSHAVSEMCVSVHSAIQHAS